MTNSLGRPDFDLITGWIEPGHRVLDLGCGDGSLLKHLIDTRGVHGVGVEIDDAAGDGDGAVVVEPRRRRPPVPPTS